MYGCYLALEVITEGDGYQDTDDDGRQKEKVSPGKEIEICRRSHFVETTANGSMYDCGTKYAEPSACPKWDELDANVGTDDVNDPVWGEGGYAEDDEKGDHVVSMLDEFVGPGVETGLPRGKGEEGRAECGADVVTEHRAGCDACAGEG